MINTEKKEKKKDDRVRNWTFIVYPESAPENWRDQIDEYHVPWIESPLHDKDVNPDGEVKKSHWHVLIMFEGKKSLAQIEEITEKINASKPQKCANVKGLVRYMAHVDNPEKYQYDKTSIIGHAGVDVASYFEASKIERYQQIAQMMDYIDDNDITEMEDMLRYARKERFSDWFQLLCDNSAYIVGQYIKSKRHRNKK